jgi:hypothetical protein
VIEFRNTPLPPEIRSRSSEELLEDLCIALRQVGVGERVFRAGEDAQGEIRNVVAIADELEKRSYDYTGRLERLSNETGWQVIFLLDECKRFPRAIPYVRDLDGIRRQFRCRYCRRAERPEDDVSLSACDQCLSKMILTFESLKSLPGTILFKTYDQVFRCQHADDDTVLLSAYLGQEGVYEPGQCKRCLQDLLDHRRNRSTQAR